MKYISFVIICITLSFFSQVSSENTDHNKLIYKTEDSTDNRITESCKHENYVLKCCVGVDYKLNFTSCVSIEYLPNEYGLELNVTLNGLLLVNRKVSAKNPPPLCFAAPYMEKIANVCFRFHDLDEDKKIFKGCVSIEGHVEGLKVFKYELGCFEIPLLRTKNVPYIVQLMQTI